MRSCWHGLALVVLTLLIPNVSIAANRYIRDGATGTLASTGCGTWEATSACDDLPATLTRGDTYYFADGNYKGRQFDTPHSGTTLITFKKATIADHGTEIGWLNSYGDGQAVFDAIEFLTGYWVFDGQVRTSSTSGHGFKILNTAANKCLALTTGSPGSVDNITLRFIEVQGLGLDNLTFDIGIRIVFGPQNVVIQKVYVHDTGGATIQMRFTNNLLIEDSVFARNSSSPAQHAEGVSASGDSNVTIRNNVWMDIEGTGFIICLGSAATNCDNWDIYGNVFAYSDGNPFNREGVGDGSIAVINGMNANNWNIINNTFINIPAPPGLTSRVGFVDAGTGTNRNIKNNIWFQCANASHSGSFIADSNYYINTPFTTGETNSQTQPPTDPFVNWKSGNFRLTRPTNPGVTLTLPAGITTDAMGVTRGIDGVWDRGAFEFRRPDPPQNLRTP